MKNCENQTLLGSACRKVHGCLYLEQFANEGDNFLAGCPKETDIRAKLQSDQKRTN